MRNNSFDLANTRVQRQRRARGLLCVVCCLLIAGCATPQYSVHPTPVPDESSWVIQLERTISAYQAREFERQGTRPLHAGERVSGLDVQRTVDRLSRVTERPSLNYQAFLVQDKDPNAAALADGRVYMTTGMLRYLASRGGDESELAFVLAHELGHTVAQHLVKRYQQLQHQQLMVSLVALGASVATQQGGAQGQQIGELAQDAASLISEAATSSYSQEQELEADQLGIRYVMRAGYRPTAAFSLLEDFTRFDVAGPFFRTHPYIQRRAEDLRRYLSESGTLTATARPSAPTSREEQRTRLLEAQKLYPVGSQSWKNIQQQLDALKRPHP